MGLGARYRMGAYVLYNCGTSIVLMYIEDNRIKRTSLVVIYNSSIRSSGMIVL